MSKMATLLLITVLVVSSLVIVGSVFAQSIPKPSVPEFTVELVDSSYDVPTTYSIDPFTGENVTHEGYHVKSTSIQVKIKNKPFTSFWIQENPLAANWTVNFFYNIRMKGHFSEDWIELYNPSDGYVHQDSESEYTVRTYTWGGGDADSILGTKMIRIPVGAEVDFQVEAMIGYVHRDASTFWAPWVFEGEKSGWSGTQTITILDNQTPTPSLEPTPTPSPELTPTPYSEPQQLGQEVILGVAVTIAVIAVGLGLLLYLIKRK